MTGSVPQQQVQGQDSNPCSDLCSKPLHSSVSWCRYSFPTLPSVACIFRHMWVVSGCTYFFSLAFITQHYTGDTYPSQQSQHLGIHFYYWEVFLCSANNSFFQSHVGRCLVVSNDLLTQAMVPCTSVCTVKGFLQNKHLGLSGFCMDSTT